MKQKLLVISSDNRNIRPLPLEFLKYNELSFFINSYYCLKYNYQFKYYKMNDLKKYNNQLISSYCSKSKLTKSSSWTKLLVILNQLNTNCDYLIYLDSDCFFNNFNEDIKKYITKMKKLNKKGLFFNDEPWNCDLPNCGFFILKNCDYNKKLLKDWWNSFSIYNHIHPYEQSTFHKFWKKNYKNCKNEIILINSSLQIDKVKNKLLLHITSDKDKLRKKIMLENIKINTFFSINLLSKFISKNKINIDPKLIDHKINGKTTLLDKIAIKINCFIQLNLINLLKKLKSLKVY